MLGYLKMTTAALATLALAACATVPGAADAPPSAKVQSYLDHAGEPVESFRLFGNVDSWNPLSDHRLLVRTGVRDTYLLSVDASCLNLQFANRIALTTSLGNRVQTGFDYVRFDDGFQGQRCRITDIRPVDADAARKDLATSNG